MPLTKIPEPTVSGTAPADAWDYALRASILIFLGLILYSSMVSYAFEPVARMVERHEWASLIVRPSAMWLIAGMLLLVFRTLLWYRYQPEAPATAGTAPFLTVVIPAYNEGAMVAQTIDSVAAAHYPLDRIEVIAVDDGSRDDTWQHIQQAAARYPGLVTPVHFEQNRGKRAALEVGFRRARGTIVVTAAVIAYGSDTFSTTDYAKVGWLCILIAIAYGILVMAPWYAILGIPVWDPTAVWPFGK